MRHIVLLSLLALTTGCASTLDKAAFRYDIPQGNVIEQKQLDQIKPGMTQTEVTHILGSPVFLDPFHKNRWDYVQRLTAANGITTQTHVALFFDKAGKLTKITGQIVPAQS